MSNAILYRMAAGIPGDVTRHESATIEAQQIDATTLIPLKYGIPVKMVSGKIEKINNTSDAVYGFLVRPYPTQGATNEALGTSTPVLTQLCDVLRRGYMTVLCATGTAVKNAQVYFNNTTGFVEAYYNGGSGQTAITGCYFMGGADADGNVEISFNL